MDRLTVAHEMALSDPNTFGSTPVIGRTPGFLAAYNAGPARYDEHLMNGRPLPGETQDYVAKLAPMIGVQQGEDQKGAAFDLFAWLHAALFPPQADPSPGAVLLAVRAQPDRSPAVRRVVDLSALAPSSEGLFVRLASETGSRRSASHSIVRSKGISQVRD